MYIRTLTIILLALFASCLPAKSAAPQKSPVAFADPCILYYEGTYYLYGTGTATNPVTGAKGFSVLVSKDLHEWSYPDGVHPHIVMDISESYGNGSFWAPECFQVGDKFIFYYSAEMHLCCAIGDSPLGPFHPLSKEPMMVEKGIDSTLFIDDDGTPYIFFVRFVNGNEIWMAELEKDYMHIKLETLRFCVRAELPWELVKYRITEGPNVVKHNGIYYLTYSANDCWVPEYAIGFATTDDLNKPFKKYEGNPIFIKPQDKLVGVGHHDFFKDAEGRDRIVFHSHPSKTATSPRLTHITDFHFEPDGQNPDKMVISEDFFSCYYAPKKYQNPVVRTNLADPTVMRYDGMFYLYSTESRRELPIMVSRDMVNWRRAGAAFTPEGRPGIVPRAGIWAPDINCINDKFVLYYAMSVWGGEDSAAIGVAVADNPLGPFEDKGKLLDYASSGVMNSIDGCYYEDDGHKYLFWGSFHGIYAIELTDDGLAVKPGAQKVLVAGDAYEGTMIFKKGGYYYLFASIDSCCEGARSKYKTVVGRSHKLLGPYVDSKGGKMTENRHELVIQGNATFAGTGHNAEIMTDDAGNDWILYHAYIKSAPAIGRTLCMDKLIWEKGWPKIEGKVPGNVAPVPVINSTIAK